MEVVTAVLERIDAVNPRINAVVRRVDGVLDAARRADEQLARGQAAGPLHGLPFTIKDSFDTAGIGDDGWHDRVARTRASDGCDRGRPPARRGRDPRREDEHAGVHVVGRDR